MARKSNPDRSKKQILAWAKEHGRLPRRTSKFKIERSLGSRLENYMSTQSDNFDPVFRSQILSLFPERRVHDKRSHDVKQRIEEVTGFIKANHRAPSIDIPSERKLYRSLGNLTAPSCSVYDPKVAALISKLDPCHKTFIAKKYRRQINTALEGVKLVPERKFLKKV
jgi:hypothetical protein